MMRGMLAASRDTRLLTSSKGCRWGTCKERLLEWVAEVARKRAGLKKLLERGE